MLKGRPRGIKIPFGMAYAIAESTFGYWYRKGEGEIYAVWQDDRHIVTVDTPAKAKNAIVRDFARALGAEEEEE